MTIGIALVGIGVRGRQWERVINESDASHVSLVVDPAGREGSNVPQVASLDEVPPGIGIDAAIVASPPSNHAEAVLWAVRRGIPVLCEKPLTESYLDSRKLVDSTLALGGELSVGMNFRYVAAAQALRRAVREERFGRLLFGSFAYITNRDGRHPELNDFPLWMHDPMLVEQTIHHLDLLRYAYQRRVVRVGAASWNPSTSVYRHDSCVAAILEFEGGVYASYLGTWTAGSRRMEYRWRTDFSDGVAVQEDPFGDLAVSSRVPGMWRTARPSQREVEPLEWQGLPAGDEFHFETSQLLHEFEQSIAGGPSELPTAVDYLETMLVLEAIRKAGRKRMWVELAEVEMEEGTIDSVREGSEA